jgi:predicted nucleotidyltransferase
MELTRPIEAIVPGAQGRVLAVLTETTAELNLRTIARLAGVSPAQASRLLPDLVALGVVERREVPPSSLFRLVRDHVASRFLLGLADSHRVVLDEMGRLASDLPHPPTSVIVFGSFARREADVDSDLDVLVVRPNDIAAEDDAWFEALENWRQAVERLTGNRVEIVEVGQEEAGHNLAEGRQLWADIARDGQVVHGRSLAELNRATNG